MATTEACRNPAPKAVNMLHTIVESRPEPPDSRPPTFDVWADLTPSEAERLRSSFVELTVRAGERFIRCGDRADCLYLLRRGEVAVRRDSQTLAYIATGQIVGEMALLNREPRNADVVALTDCQLWRLSADDFAALYHQLPRLKLLLTRLVAHRLNWSGSDVLARRIGPYQVVEEIGRGSMGWVFRATRDGQTYAMKMLPHPLVEKPIFLERYRTEARLLRLLRHENIVSLHDLIELYGTLFLVMEFINGISLHAWREQSAPVNAVDVRCIAQSVTRALHAAHAQGIIHRDVKPSNVMINTAGIVKLVDFGIATDVTHEPSTGKVSLTPCYAAPEQFEGKWTPATDYYSLGVIVYELLAGESPYTADSIDGWMRAHREVQPRPLPGNNPEDLKGFVNAALTKDPSQRWAQLQSFLQTWSGQTAALTISRPPALSAP